ncbi:MAG: VPA1262 family N-terminal domain-containing protein [Methylobacter sp.]|uniref:VPA1262 family N-terminal domain-containing protein n=1 Tax=Methylobacter sp. TaxID=2051955 RepID=UPI00273025D5|nr:VPA1262 family N-terminal domain-containing protein [Methylobacter sp.]MDP1664171.1 VPA1262 family N-terminal domain-containing protein [Methylobacter sp.]
MTTIDHHEWAIIRLATLQQRGQAGRLLFATVTLLSPDRPPPPKMNSADRRAVGKSGATIFFRRTVLAKQAAIDWYRSLGNGDEKTPTPSRPEDIEKIDGVKIAVSNLIDDPIWPHIGLPMGEGLLSQPTGHSHPAPFMGSVPARIHRRFGSHEGFDALLADDDALAFVARRLHIDLRQYPEYLGSIALVVPDPIIKQIDNFMIPASNERGERIFYRFVPRPCQTLEGLQITTFDEQAHLLTSFETQDIPADGILDVDKGSCLGAYGYVVTHPEHGILAYMPLTGFLRTIHFSSHAVGSGGATVSVHTGDSPDSARMEYPAANRSQFSTNSIVGEEPSSPNVNARVAIAASRREKLASAKQYGQRWFSNGSREEAMRFVQGEIRKARSRVLIVDPYLGGLQLGQFLYAVNGDMVKVALLTSGLAFKSQPSKLDDFKNRLDRLEKDVKVKAAAYVLASSVLHDRFLVIDDTVWFLGNSLNTLGDKTSMIVKLPDPDEVIGQLESLLKQAENFDSYKEKLSKVTPETEE